MGFTQNVPHFYIWAGKTNFEPQKSSILVISKIDFKPAFFALVGLVRSA